MLKVTYPGVYVEEVPSGSISIVGVQTAVTAFVGRAVMGPVNTPTTCFSFGEFETKFGGRNADLSLGYAVEDFFLNGGAEAVIVRVVAGPPVTNPDSDKPQGGDANAGKPPARPPALASKATATIALGGALGSLKLTAANEGAWGNSLTAAVDRVGLTSAVVASRGGTIANSFNITLTYTSPRGRPTQERFTAVNTTDPDNGVEAVLSRSLLARAQLLPVARADDSGKPPADAGKPDPNKPNAGKPTPPAVIVPTAFTGGADGPALADTDLIGDGGARTGLHALDGDHFFNILCIPWDQRGKDVAPEVNTRAAAFCASRRAMYVVDGPSTWVDKARSGQLDSIDPGTDLGITDQASQQCTAVYFPKIRKPDPEKGGRVDVFSACGVIAGQMARTDATRGVWKAPAGVANGMGGVSDLEFNLSDMQQGQLNPVGVNCLRNFHVLGPLVWGARTLRGMDLISDDYKYVPVRRLAHYIEESLSRGMKSAVFEPNDETLWSQIRLTVRSFMSELARQGAFYSFNVACDAKTTTQDKIDEGICVVEIMFAPVKPAEFIVLRIQQSAGASA